MKSISRYGTHLDSYSILLMFLFVCLFDLKSDSPTQSLFFSSWLSQQNHVICPDLKLDELLMNILNNFFLMLLSNAECSAQCKVNWGWHMFFFFSLVYNGWGIQVLVDSAFFFYFYWALCVLSVIEFELNWILKQKRYRIIKFLYNQYHDWIKNSTQWNSSFFSCFLRKDVGTYNFPKSANMELKAYQLIYKTQVFMTEMCIHGHGIQYLNVFDDWIIIKQI